MTDYFLGVDVGATKTHALITDAEGNLLGKGTAGGGNPTMTSYELFGRVVAAATWQALAQARITMPQISAAGFGVAGYDWPSQRGLTLAALDLLELTAPCDLVNDAVLGLLANARRGWGISLVAGTGCNCWGRNQHGQMGHMTGAGNILGEYAGGSELIARALHRVAYAWTGREGPTALSDAFIAAAGAQDLEDLVAGLTINRYVLDASHAPLIFDCAAQGDAAALELLHWAGDELGVMVITVARQIGVQQAAPDVVLIGGLFKGTPSLQDLVEASVRPQMPGVTFVSMQAPPVIGAVILAMERARRPAHAIRQALLALQTQAPVTF
ncbi:BadF/BadG/BcrA/BcrD ATPase family protein [Candidatus Amarolinea dominans]|uniref:N-acetylglucosamine kinase n=1 Tax=Candidatus Amarolinea dominans TaxID=3140696 RepID=UPI001D7EE7BE|nr:hypothetical protein [Anaerolineae bacterium]